MNFPFLTFMLALAVTQTVSGLPLACSYNETLYKEGENVATEEPCLSCVCRKGSLVCTLRVCADSPEPLPPGCFLVHRPKDCCPQLLCEEGFSQNGVELRSGFKAEKKLIENGCFINGSAYAEGSAVASSQPCEYCYCIQGEVKCIKPRCLHPFDGCRPLYEGPSCCPTHYDCRNVTVDVPTTPNTRVSGCEFEGAYYSEGELVESENSSKCETCYCVEGKVKCAPIECPMDVFENCQPFSSPDQCCPTSFSCGNDRPKTGNNSEGLLPPPPKAKVEISRPNKEYKSTEMPAHSTEATRPRESENTTAEENITEGSTGASETEATTLLVLLKIDEEPSAVENLTSSPGFQVEKFQNGPAVAIAEETTLEPESTSPPDSADPVLGLSEKQDVFDVEIQSKLDFADQREAPGLAGIDGILSNSSQEFQDDYDSYDYSEPKLPPSLPNLVIFPFVAADAVVQGDSGPRPETYVSNSVKRIDTQATFYKDYFSPPARTEGGFVPKEPALPGEPFYDHSFYKKEENSSSVKKYTKIVAPITAPSKLEKEKCYSDGRELDHGELLSEAGDCVSCACLHGSIICQDVACPTPEPGCKRVQEKLSSCCGRIACEPNSPDAQTPITTVASLEAVADALSETSPSEAQLPPDLLLTGHSTTFLLSHDTKPVTVAYKNIIVDYYPDYLITRNNLRTKNDEKKPQKGFVSATSPPGFSFSDLSSPPPREDSTKTQFTHTTAVTTASESSFFDKLFKNFLSEDRKSTTRPVPKYKYSSKIKSPVVTTTEPNVKDVTQDAKPAPNRQIPSTSSYSLFDFLFDSEPPPTSPKPKTTKKGESELHAPHPPQEELRPTSRNEPGNKEGQEQQGGGVQVKANLGSFLKLAGCNIYGRMYRVGKIIIELSGPCLECVCTDFGVQCKPLIC